MHSAGRRSPDSNEPRTRCWLGLRGSYDDGIERGNDVRSLGTNLQPASTVPRRIVAHVRLPARTEGRPMTSHPRAGQPAQPTDLVDVPALLRAYSEIRPDPSDPAQRVAFGTSGHRGSAFRAAFNEAHILATTEAICRYRAGQGYTGPLFIGRDTHALSEPAWRTALEVLVAHDVDVRVDARDGY